MIRFLSELGKEGPFQVSKARLVRTWHVLADQPTSRAALAAQGPEFAAADTANLVWSPVTSTVAGVLPLGDMPLIPRGDQTAGGGFSAVRFEVTVPISGKLRLRLDDATGLQCWADKAPQPAATEIGLQLAPGAHTISVAVDRQQRKTPLRVELVDEP